MTTQAGIDTKTVIQNGLARTLQTVMADSSAALPTKIQIIKSGDWTGSWKGDLQILPTDLMEMKNNYDLGVGMPSGLNQLPIDFAHEDWSQAAGWMQGMTVEPSTDEGDAPGTMVAYANPVEWSDAGQAALKGGQFKCFSPSFWPACLGMWQDPEDPTITARNVLSGGALTNIPFFKGLTPIMASTASTKPEDGRKNIMYVNASAKEQSMNLDELRVKDANSLSDEEKTFITEHKSELSADEQTKFGIAEAPAATEGNEEDSEGEAAKTPEEVEAEAVNASLKSGEKVLVEASTFKSMQKDLIDLKREKIEADVDKHIERGAIKSDQKKNWADRIMADDSMKSMLVNLPSNQLLADEIGSKEGIDENQAEEQIHEKVSDKLAASREAGKPLSYSAARRAVIKEMKGNN